MVASEAPFSFFWNLVACLIQSPPYQFLLDPNLILLRLTLLMLPQKLVLPLQFRETQQLPLLLLPLA